MVMVADSEQVLVKLSIVIPVLNDAECLEILLKQLKGFSGEVVVVDGGSADHSKSIVEAHGYNTVESEPGRAKQMNLGARQATGDVFWFLHSDSVLPLDYEALIASALQHANVHWGRFDVKLSGHAQLLRVVEFMMNLRSSWTGICTGDQGIFVRREVFEQVGGFPEIALMEDIGFSKSMSRKPFCIRHPLVTSSRRWEQNGIMKTIALMWWLRLRFFFGADPSDLADRYRHQGKR